MKASTTANFKSFKHTGRINPKSLRHTGLFCKYHFKGYKDE
jgi:hypothetical protein